MLMKADSQSLCCYIEINFKKNKFGQYIILTGQYSRGMLMLL